MNYAFAPLPAECICCGAELRDTDDQDLTGVACNECFADSEAKAAAAKVASDVDEFRWLSVNWFRTSHLERQPFGTRLEFY